MSFCMKAAVFFTNFTAPPLDQNKTLVIRSSDVILLLCKISFWSRGGAVLNFRHKHLKIEENGANILL